MNILAGIKQYIFGSGSVSQQQNNQAQHGMAVNNSSERESFLYGVLGHLFNRLPTPENRDINHIYGYKNPNFRDLLELYENTPIAGGGVDKIVDTAFKYWPEIKESKEGEFVAGDGKATAWEKSVNKFMKRKKVYPAIHAAVKAGFIGDYSAIIISTAISNQADLLNKIKPRDKVLGFIPAWQNQIKVSRWNEDITSPRYGQVEEWEYTANPYIDVTKEIGVQMPQTVQKLHYSRVLCFCNEGKVTPNQGRSRLRRVYNTAMDALKISGAGAELPFSNAAGVRHFEYPKETDLSQVETDADKQKSIKQMVDELQRGFKGFTMGNFKHTMVSAEVPNLEPNFGIVMQGLAAGFGLPVPVLVGNLTGERASQENDRALASRGVMCQTQDAGPYIERLVEHLCLLGVDGLRPPPGPIIVDWPDLYSIGDDELAKIALTLAQVNAALIAHGYPPVFDWDEIRAAFGLGPMTPEQRQKMGEEQYQTDGQDVPPNNNAPPTAPNPENSIAN